MPTFSSQRTGEVRIERMRPEQIDQAIARRAAMYVPFGSLEWHGYHNPVGLDALKAHEQLVGLAQQAGGLVYPPRVLWRGRRAPGLAAHLYGQRRTGDRDCHPTAVGI